MPLRAPEIIIAGGGAAAFFAAIACKTANPAARVMMLERGGSVLSKVRISGGGRCNVTHNQMDPALLARNYPRGGKALRGPFTRFGPRETIDWYVSHGVELKTEPDGRMFPVTDDSGTVIDCLERAARDAAVEVRTKTPVTGVRHDGDRFTVTLQDGATLEADRVLLATGGAPASWGWAAAMGHDIEAPVPSLFTFNIKDPRIDGLAGISVSHARVKLDGARESHDGPLLVTHWGLSGPAVLKTSAWGARLLHDSEYRLGVTIDLRPDLDADEVRGMLESARERDARKSIQAHGPFGLPQRLWRSLAAATGVDETRRWADLTKAQLEALAREVHAGHYRIEGKGVFKEEFVTCGGVNLKQVNFKTMESRVQPGLFFAGEILDIDGVTGGFNFQSAWTTGWLAGNAMAEPLT